MEERREKVCRCCGGDPQPLHKFYKAKTNADGHTNTCKVCTRKEVRENQALKREVYREKKRIRENSPKYKEMRAAWRRSERGRRLMKESRKAWAVLNPERNAEIQRKHWKQSNDKRKAARQARKALPPGDQKCCASPSRYTESPEAAQPSN